jgi:L-histidine N-alpha-methyltransferase
MSKMLALTEIRAWQSEAFCADVLAGLSGSPKTLPSRWLYDDRGSELFEEITQLDEYYPTRTETAILRDNAQAIADFCGARAVLIEYGAGAGVKTEIVLDALTRPSLYVPIDISAGFLELTAERIGRRFPQLAISPVVADFTTEFDLPHALPSVGRRVGFFPGSTVGNLDAPATTAFLKRMRHHVDSDGRALIGVDLKKDVDRLIAAYDDRDGVTAEFNLNLLARINRELHGDFQLRQFAHEARWNEAGSAIEMHLVSLADQTVTVEGRRFHFADGKSIHTETCRKYDIDSFAEIAKRCGWTLAETWQDSDRLFAVLGLHAAAG